MSRISKEAAKMSAKEKTRKELHLDEAETNFMGGTSYKLDPLETLKMVGCSSIFGEPQYYRASKKPEPKFYPLPVLIARNHTIRDSQTTNFEVDILDDVKYEDLTTSQLFEKLIDEALDYDFLGTLKLASTMRHDYYMRLNPQVIMVRAAIHPGRKKFTEEHPGTFAMFENSVMSRADEPATQAAYYLYLNKGKKNNMPSVLKRSIALKLSKLNKYQVNKYKNAEIGMINTVRLVHATSPVIDELMKTGTVEVPEENKTWEQLRSAGMSWKEIVDKDVMPHMAMLRNIRNVFSEVDDLEFCKKYMKKLKDGVLNGKQFPFRYKSAWDSIFTCVNKEIHHRQYIMDVLEECIDIAIDNLPHLKGTTVCLSDNSGSAWGVFTSEYGSVTVAEIDNLSSVIAAKCSDEGTVVKFGDMYKEYPVSKRNGTLTITKLVNETGGRDVGHSTEGGIWKWFCYVLDNNIKIDNIFIFSDKQAGTGGLYGTDSDMSDYIKGGYGIGGFSWRKYINVYKLILAYRKHVNPKVNVFSVQTAGYTNAVVPSMSYRTAILTGWTGKEIAFAAEYIKQWDEIEAKREAEKAKKKKVDDAVNKIAQEVISNEQMPGAGNIIEAISESVTAVTDSINNPKPLDAETREKLFNALTEGMTNEQKTALKIVFDSINK